MSEFELFEDYIQETKEKKIDLLKNIINQIKREITHYEQERSYYSEINNTPKQNELYYILKERYDELERINFYIKNYVLIKWTFIRYDCL